jgi:succinate dehydrogenase/fumarate reductase flavoprotein subunit
MSATNSRTRRSVAVVGGGWAGCAAALELLARLRKLWLAWKTYVRN